MIGSEFRIKTKYSYEDFFILLMILVWTRLILVSYVYQTFCLIPGLSSVANILKISVYVIAVLGALQYLISKIRLLDIIVYLFIVIAYIINQDVFPRTAEYLQLNMVEILFISIPAYFVGLGMVKREYINILFKWSKISLIAIVLHFMVFGLQSDTTGSLAEDMSLAYRLIPHLCLIAVYTFNEHKKSNWLYLIVGCFILLACGTRGAVLCFAVMCFACYLMSGFTRNKLIITTIGLTLLLFLYFNFSSFIMLIANFLQQFGLSTRIADALLLGNFTNDNGRFEIAEFMFQLVKDNNWKGFGIAGDRGWIPWMAYSHNIAIELIVSYGLLVGIILFIVILFIIARSFSIADFKQKCFIIAMIFGGGFFKLFLSSSYLLEFQFFMLLGYSVNIIRNRRNNIEKEQYGVEPCWENDEDCIRN